MGIVGMGLRRMHVPPAYMPGSTPSLPLAERRYRPASGQVPMPSQPLLRERAMR